MTNEQVLINYKSLIDLRQRAILFPAGVSYAIMRNLKLLKPIVQDIEESRNQIAQTYGEPSESDVSYYIIKPENQAKAQEELASLAAADNNITLNTIKLSQIEHMDLAIKDMEDLYFMLDEE